MLNIWYVSKAIHNFDFSFFFSSLSFGRLNSLFITSLFEDFVHLVVTWAKRAADLVRQFGTVLVGRALKYSRYVAETKTRKQEKEGKKNF